MKNPIRIQSRQAAIAALLLVLATASGCGALPTQPSLEPTTTPDRSSVTMTADTPSPIRIDEGSGGGGSSPGVGGSPTIPVDPSGITIQLPTPGNSNWGHSHKKPKKNR